MQDRVDRPIHHTDFEPAQSWHGDHMRAVEYSIGDMSRAPKYTTCERAKAVRIVLSPSAFQNGSGSKLPSRSKSISCADTLTFRSGPAASGGRKPRTPAAFRVREY